MQTSGYAVITAYPNVEYPGVQTTIITRRRSACMTRYLFNPSSISWAHYRTQSIRTRPLIRCAIWKTDPPINSNLDIRRDGIIAPDLCCCFTEENGDYAFTMTW